MAKPGQRSQVTVDTTLVFMAKPGQRSQLAVDTTHGETRPGAEQPVLTLLAVRSVGRAEGSARDLAPAEVSTPTGPSPRMAPALQAVVVPVVSAPRHVVAKEMLAGITQLLTR